MPSAEWHEPIQQYLECVYVHANLSRILATVGIRSIGRLTRTSSLTSSPSFLRISTRPAILRSLSNQVCQTPAPYGCTRTCRKPPFAEYETGFNLGHGLSVWAATTWKPFPGLYLHKENSIKTYRCVNYSLTSDHCWLVARGAVVISWPCCQTRNQD